MNTTIKILVIESTLLIFFIYLAFFTGYGLVGHWTQVPTVMICILTCCVLMSLIVPTTASLLGPKQ